MFESAELGHCISDRVYDRAEARLREALLKAQSELLESKSFPVIIVIGGVDGAGKSETVNILNKWMDPRHLVTHAFGETSAEERERPRMARYWRALPPKGRIGILTRSSIALRAGRMTPGSSWRWRKLCISSACWPKKAR